MSREEVWNAVQVLVGLDRRDRAEAAAELLPEGVQVAELLRASDGIQRLARALAARRRGATPECEGRQQHDPHDVGSLYS